MRRDNVRLYRKPLVRLWIDCAWEMRVNVPDGLLTYKVEGPGVHGRSSAAYRGYLRLKE